MCFAVSIIPISIIGGTQGFRASFYLIGLIFFVTFIASLIIAYFISRPLEKLTNNIRKISKGEMDVQLGSSEISEINNLTESLNRVMASLKLAVHKVGVKKGEIFEDAVKAKEAFEKKQRDLFNSINGWAWETDKEGVYTFVSDNTKDILGYKPGEMIGRNVFEFMESNDAKKSKKIFNISSKKKYPIKNHENGIIDKNGEKICVVTNGYPYFDDEGNLLGYRGVNTDVTKLKNSEMKIKELNKDLSELKIKITELLREKEKNKKNGQKTISNDTIDTKWSEHNFDSVFIFDENANIVDCNDNMFKKLGYTKSEFLSLNMSDFDALESKNDIKRKIKLAKKDGAVSFKTIHKRKDGSAILVHENVQYLNDKKRYKCIVREDYSIKKSK